MRNDRNSNDNILVVRHEAHLDTTVLPRVHNFNTERFGLSFLRDVCVTLITAMSDWKKSIRDGRYIVMMNIKTYRVGIDQFLLGRHAPSAIGHLDV